MESCARVHVLAYALAELTVAERNAGPELPALIAQGHLRSGFAKSRVCCRAPKAPGTAMVICSFAICPAIVRSFSWACSGLIECVSCQLEVEEHVIRAQWFVDPFL